MRATVNVSKKALICLAACCILGITLLTAILFSELYRTGNYYKTDGVVVSVEKTIDYGSRNNGSPSPKKYIELKYSVNGKEYYHKYRTFLTVGKKTGSKIKICYDPIYPEKVRNSFLIECCFFGGSILLIFFLALIVLIRSCEES